jgi:hypothetical protein
LVREFPGYECEHGATLGWKGTENGELLAKAEQFGFDVLITFDKGIPRDHEIPTRPIAVYIVSPEGQGPRATRALIGEVLEALKSCHRGQVMTFTNRTRKRRT